MKKAVTLMPIFILALSLLYPCLYYCDVAEINHDLTVYACEEVILDEDYTVQNETPATDSFTYGYFQHLSAHGKNYQGSCGYVAIGMWLSYYDAYWNDNIIPSVYDYSGSYGVSNDKLVDVSSPGIYDPILNQDNPLRQKENWQLYKNYMINEQAPTNFHAYLIKIGNELGYLNNRFGLLRQETYNILCTYLDRQSLRDSFVLNYYAPIVDFDDIYPGTNYSYSEYMRQQVIEYVKLDMPVIVFLRGNADNNNDDIKGHIVIAYDYDEETDTLYAHFGKSHSQRHSNVFDFGYSRITGYIVGAPNNLEHVHAYNYKNFYDEQQTICSCQLSNHKHKYQYEIANATQHRRYCYCGDSAYQIHRFSETVGRYVTCEKCNYRKLNDGGIIDIPNPNSTPEILEDMKKIKDKSSKEQYLMSA